MIKNQLIKMVDDLFKKWSKDVFFNYTSIEKKKIFQINLNLNNYLKSRI